MIKGTVPWYNRYQHIQKTGLVWFKISFFSQSFSFWRMGGRLTWSKGLVRKFITTCTCTTNKPTCVVCELDVQGFSINGSIPLFLVKCHYWSHILLSGLSPLLHNIVLSPHVTIMEDNVEFKYNYIDLITLYSGISLTSPHGPKSTILSHRTKNVMV